MTAKRILNMKIGLALVAVMSSMASLAQDIHFSQFFEAPLLRNPSLAGIYTGDIRVQAVYRDQWNSVTTAYKTGSLNAEYKMPVGKGDDFLTTGLQIMYDKAGTAVLSATHILPALNYHKSLSTETNRYLSLGFMAGPVQRRIDRSKMTTNSQYDGMGDGENFESNSYTYFDGAVGMSFNSQLTDNKDDNFFIGLAYHHFNKPKNSFYRNETFTLQPKYVGSIGVKFGVTDISYITLQADHSIQGDFKETVGGALYGVKLVEGQEGYLYTLHAGAFLRVEDAIIPVVKLDYNPFSVSLSYDVNISKLRTSSMGRGGFELGISYMGFVERKRGTSAMNATLCPRF